jgi:hypothetical protein
VEPVPIVDPPLPVEPAVPEPPVPPEPACARAMLGAIASAATAIISLRMIVSPVFG